MLEATWEENDLPSCSDIIQTVFFSFLLPLVPLPLFNSSAAASLAALPSVDANICDLILPCLPRWRRWMLTSCSQQCLTWGIAILLRYCMKCPNKPPGVVNVNNKKRCECGTKTPKFGMPGDLLREARWCMTCPTRPKGSISLCNLGSVTAAAAPAPAAADPSPAPAPPAAVDQPRRQRQPPQLGHMHQQQHHHQQQHYNNNGNYHHNYHLPATSSNLDAADAGFGSNGGGGGAWGSGGGSSASREEAEIQAKRREVLRKSEELMRIQQELAMAQAELAMAESTAPPMPFQWNQAPRGGPTGGSMYR